ncbi:hypothetical protein HW555_003624 [Spodoptera exigua]|uniref:MULE transposase domain-containing protein n=1 Tax=Spodoptera exigua TaxID=7107 RepID=A0A835GJT8_SPOEX|nr:hypothetical protein HW555_003624 [Spodoptera exigua]
MKPPASKLASIGNRTKGLQSVSQTQLVFEQSERGGLLLLRGGYQHNKKRENKNGTTVWCCVKWQTRKCRGRVVTKNNLVVSDDPHTCQPNFAANIIKKQLNQCRKLAATKSDPIPTWYPFYQLYTIHGDLGSSEETSNVVPLVYALLLNKKQATYEILFQIIKSQVPDWNPKKFQSDYEAAAMNAMQKIMPNCKIVGCYFHFKSALRKKAKELKLNKNPVHKAHVAICGALSLLPQHLISDGYLYIMEDCSNNGQILAFNDYFVNAWIESSFFGKWSFYGERFRTTNHLEGWHSKLNKGISNAKPSFIKFLDLLLKNIKEFDLKIKQFEQGIPISYRNKNVIDFDKRLAHIITQHQNCEITLEEKTVTIANDVRLQGIRTQKPRFKVLIINKYTVKRQFCGDRDLNFEETSM